MNWSPRKSIIIRKVIIKLFTLDDITDLIISAKQKQKQVDDKHWHDIMQENEKRLQREYSLELQEKDSTISMLEQHIQMFKDKEKEMSKKEFLVRKQVKANYNVAQGIVSQLDEFNKNVAKIYGEIAGLKDNAELHKKKIENKK